MAMLVASMAAHVTVAALAGCIAPAPKLLVASTPRQNVLASEAEKLGFIQP
jgi:hypothetical protein